MSGSKKIRDLMASMQRTTYAKWQRQEGLPIIEGYGVEDLREVELGPWRRLGGKGAFIQLYGIEGFTGMYVAEIPPGGSLEPERHMYEEVICVLQGQGATEVWQDGGRKHMFEWGAWSVFAPPLNSWHRLINGSNEPVRFMAVTNAPLIMDVFHNFEFVFSSPYQFADRYAGEETYFSVGTKRYSVGRQNLWETNFIPDVREAGVDEKEIKGAGVRITQFELSGNGLVGHVAEWPVGRYQKAHYHAAGAVLLILRSQGYVLLWPKEVGIRPYEAGRGEEVVEVKWREGSIYCPPAGWFHQHFNVGKEKARQLATRFGSRIYPIGYHIAAKGQEDGAQISVRDGGTLIEYEDEDPQIRRNYEAALKANGLVCQMPKIAA